MDSNRMNEESKRPYEKPALRVIELAADEVLAVGCKNNTAPARLGVTCLANRCAGSGS